MDADSIETRELARRLRETAKNHPLTEEMRDYIRLADTRLVVLAGHHERCVK